MIRPSALPALAQCPKFEGDGAGSDDARAGTARHSLFAAQLRGQATTGLNLTDEELAGVEWAADYVRLHKPDGPLVIEERRSFTDSTFETVAGTPDVICGAHLFDLKWRADDYRLQMAAYVQMIEADPVTVHVLYAERRRAEVFVLSQGEAEDLVQQVIERARDPAAVPVPCDFCGWCGRRLTCPALLTRVNAVVDGRADWGLDVYHPSLVVDAEEMGKALRLARLLKEWVESVEHHAKEMAIKEGKVPTGFRLTSRQGRRELPDVAATFAAAALPQDLFLKACEVGFTDLVKLYADFHGMKKAPAERDLESKLGPLIQRRSSTQYLSSEKE